MRVAAYSPRELLAAAAVLLCPREPGGLLALGNDAVVVDEADGGARGHRARGARG